MAIIRKRNHRLLKEESHAMDSYEEDWTIEELNSAIDNTFSALNAEAEPGEAFYIEDIRVELEEVQPAIFDTFEDSVINKAIRDVAKRMEAEGLIDNIIFVDDDTYYDYD